MWGAMAGSIVPPPPSLKNIQVYATCTCRYPHACPPFATLQFYLPLDGFLNETQLRYMYTRMTEGRTIAHSNYTLHNVDNHTDAVQDVPCTPRSGRGRLLRPPALLPSARQPSSQDAQCGQICTYITCMLNVFVKSSRKIQSSLV